MAYDVRALEPSEIRSANALFLAALQLEQIAEERASAAEALNSPDRTLGAHDGDTLVATAAAFPCTMAVPGGAGVPAACVTRVGVRADHTRRGILSAMMHAQLADVAARGEVLASLRASEGRIYGRFGYGVATRGRDLKVRRSGRGWLPTAPRGGSVRLLDRTEIISVLTPLHEKLALQRPGGITRTDGWWTARFARNESGTDPIIAAVHTGQGGDDGFLIASPKSPDDVDFTARPVSLGDLHAADTAATAGLWRFLLDLDLIGTIEASLRPLDEPLELMLADPRECTTTDVGDEAWLRIVDVPAALAARSYGPAAPVLVGVHDRVLESNAGVYLIADGTAERVGPIGGSTRPELECDVSGLAMAYLGDRAPSQLASTGWWTVNDPAAVARADAAFATTTVPWCGTFF